MKLYFVRHGHSEANLHNVISNRGDLHPLTTQGRCEAQTLAAALAERAIDHIFTSPLSRARETAEVVAEATGASVEVSDALREYDMGELEGRSDPNSWAQYWALSDDWLRRGQWGRKPLGGESLFDIRDRFLRLVDGLRSEESERSYVLLGHGGLYRCVLPFVLANVDFSFTVDNNLDHTRYVLAEKRGASFICRQWVGRDIGEDEWLYGLSDVSA